MFVICACSLINPNGTLHVLPVQVHVVTFVVHEETGEKHAKVKNLVTSSAEVKRAWFPLFRHFGHKNDRSSNVDGPSDGIADKVARGGHTCRCPAETYENNQSREAQNYEHCCAESLKLWLVKFGHQSHDKATYTCSSHENQLHITNYCRSFARIPIPDHWERRPKNEE